MEKKNKGSVVGRVLMIVGLVLVLAAAGLFAYNRVISYRAGQTSEQAVVALLDEISVRQAEQTPQEAVEIEVELHYAEAEAEATGEAPVPESIELDGAYYMGVLSMPTLDRVLPVQVDWSMDRLQYSPCRYSGTVEDQLVICAHNYITHFNELASLSPGDTVTLTELDGTTTTYVVEEICAVQPTDIEGMVESGYDLSLFTCDYSGSARVTVRCSRLNP